MKYIESTYEVLAWRVQNRGVDDKWVDWAIDMILAGFETEHLLILAGELKPFNQFYLHDLTSKVFQELGLDTLSIDKVISNYVVYLVSEAKCGRRNPVTVLAILKEFYFNYDLDDLKEFATLYWAWDDLQYGEVQWYWDGADRSNISNIIQQYFDDWLTQHEYLPL
jgi:hypothetical protein